MLTYKSGAGTMVSCFLISVIPEEHVPTITFYVFCFGRSVHVKKHTFWASPQSGVHGAFLADGACGRSRGH